MPTPPQVFARIAMSPYLPQFPPHIPRFLALLSQPEPDIDAVVAEIEGDATLRELVLKNLNSNGFGVRKQIRTIRDAILYFGLVSTRNILIFFITHAFYPPERTRHTQLFTLYRYWTHVLATAVAGEELARRAGHEEPFQLFTYGLLHDIGILGLDACLPEEEAQILERMRGGTPQLEAERSMLGGLTHEDIGGWLCKREQFPPDIACAVAHHHHPDNESGCYAVSLLLAIANSLGTEYVAPDMPVDVRIPIDMALVRAAGLQEEDLRATRSMMPARIRRFSEKPIGF